MAYYAGKTGYLKITPAGGAATNLHLEEWGLELETDEVEFTNFETYGLKALLGGIRGGTVSGSGTLEGVTAGTIMTAYQTGSGKIVEIELGLTLTGTVGINVFAVLTGLTIGNNVKEKATFEFSASLSNMDSTTLLPVALQNQALAIG